MRLKLGRHGAIQKYWRDEKVKALQKLKDALTNLKSLGYYSPKEKPQVVAEASPVALGCDLIQHDEEGPRVRAYENKSLSECEKRYRRTKKEALALVWAIEHFHIYLFAKQNFELVIDHKLFEVIFEPRLKLCARIERWVPCSCKTLE